MMRLLATELGAYGSQGGYRPIDQALYRAAFEHQIYVMRCFAEELSAAEVDGNGNTTLLHCARNGKVESVQYLLEHGGTSITEARQLSGLGRKGGSTVWDMLTAHMWDVQESALFPELPEVTYPEAMTALLKVMVLRGAPPPKLVVFLRPADTLVVDVGVRLRAQILAYRIRRRALVDAHCLLVPLLRTLVHGFEPDMPGDDICGST
jgi:hypothetical protein